MEGKFQNVTLIFSQGKNNSLKKIYKKNQITFEKLTILPLLARLCPIWCQFGTLLLLNGVKCY
jgi:hypothetical protein